MGFVLKNKAKAMGKLGIRRETKTLPDLHYVDDLSVNDKNTGKMNDFLEVLRAQGTRIGLKINVMKSNRLDREVKMKRRCLVTRKPIKMTAQMRVKVA